jgi:hypothetical protein
VPFRGQHYPPEILAMMSRVLEECMANVVNGHAIDETTLAGISTRFAQIILGAVADGQQDPEALKQIVLENFHRSAE